ncbi:MAG TPA: preprotein translocase subunit SecY [Acetobacteraceae bacterium]|nr:preprotein translocase subunit SecY [Acetobacteraceae bacterium]
MVSAAEQLAANLKFDTFKKASELQQRLLFTLGALLVYRLGTFIPIPGIDTSILNKLFENSNSVFGLLNVFSGGALSRSAIFLLNIMPYITASIIIQLLTSVLPTLEALRKEGESGRKQLNQYTRYLTVVIATVQATLTAKGLNSSALEPGWFFQLTTVISLVGGTMFLVWLGEQITARGIGNGSSLIIFAGIVAEMPTALARILEQGKNGILPPAVIIVLLLVMTAVVTMVVYFERAQRRLTIQYPKRQIGNRMFQGDSSHLPLKLNASGVIPPIFASTLLYLPATAQQFVGSTSDEVARVLALLGPGQPLHVLLYIALIVFFSFFYTPIVIPPQETADNLKKYGGFIPGYRPGPRTAQYIEYVLNRITVIGAAYVSVVCILPEILSYQMNAPFYFGGTSLLIVVSVTMDTVAQIQSHLLAHQYEGLIKKSKLNKGRTRR